MTKLHGRRIFLVTILVMLFLAVYYYFRPLSPKITIGDHVIYAEVAITPQQITKGLSHRTKLGENSGMLFVFKEKEIRTFWMHEMLFPLDILWLDDAEIVDLSANVPVKTNNSWTVVLPKVPVNRVLEVNAGTVMRLQIKVGDIVKYN